VFPLGNSLGRCPYDCVFCNVKATRLVDPREALDRFETLWDQYRAVIDGPYHPVVYNQGNGTNPRELAPAVLDHVLEAFRGDSRVAFLSLNSRRRWLLLPSSIHSVRDGLGIPSTSFLVRNRSRPAQRRSSEASRR